MEFIALNIRLMAVVAIFFFTNSSAETIAAPIGCTQTQTIAQAVRAISVDGSAPVVSTVTLPDTLAAQLLSDAAHLRYELALVPCATNALALYIFRAGAPYVVTTPEGRQLKSLVEAEHAGAQFNGRVPALFAVPPGTQTVHVVFQTKPHLLLGLLDVAIGPVAAMLPREAQALSTVVGHGRTGAAVLLVLGLLSLFLWLQRRKQDSLFWLSLGCILWGARGSIYFASDLPLPARWFELLNPLLVLCTSVCVALTCLRLLPTPTRITTGCLAVLTAAALVLFVMAGTGRPGMALSIALCLLVAYLILLWLLWWLWAHRVALQLPRWAALSISMLAMAVAGGHDILMLYRTGVPSTDPYALFWGFAMLLLVCVVLSASYLLRSLRQAESFTDQLEQTLLSKTAQLEASYALLRENEREGARVQAREHLLREMHDGIGAQLVTALRGVERGALEPLQIAQSLQDSLDELRMLMDSTDLNVYFPVALAAWRNRWDPKLAAAGVALKWHIDDSLDSITLSSDATLQVMRILQEAAANVVKHSKARWMGLNAQLASKHGQEILQIDIADDGIGLPPEAVRLGARGLKNMHHRASEIGALLEVSSIAAPLKGCRVLLELPLEKGDGADRENGKSCHAKNIYPRYIT